MAGKKAKGNTCEFFKTCPSSMKKEWGATKEETPLEGLLLDSERMLFKSLPADLVARSDRGE